MSSIEMEERSNWDAVIVGGGIAGMMTANRCGHLGLRAPMLERVGEAAEHLARLAGSQ